MTTYSDPYSSKTAWTMKLVVTESSPDAVANTSYVGWEQRLYRGDSSYPWNNSGTAYSVTGPGGASGTFPAYDFEGTHSGTDYSAIPVGGYVVIASGGDTVAHDADGSKSVTFAASHAAGATLGTASIGSQTFTLTTLTQAPGTPTGVTAARVSDTSASLAWTNNYASNGAPTSNNVQASVNGGAYATLVSFATAESVNVSTAANRKTVFKISATNSTGTSALSVASNAVYTTPAAPTGVAATKTGSDIVVTWTDNVAFTEHKHKVESAYSSDGGSSWSSWSVLTSTATGGTYTDTAPDAAKLWKYRVSAINTDVTALTSAAVTSNTVQLLTAPNAPTFGSVPSYANKAANLVLPWAHNPVDTTGQTAYEFSYSTNGGSTWSTTGKVTSGTSSYTITGSTYVANDALTIRVRTWGDATSGGSDSTGASAWSTTKLVTFKTLPVATITAPADSSTLTQSGLTVALGFSQAESATFVQATIELYDGATLLESQVSTTLAGTDFVTKVADAGSYTVKAIVLDSNGLTSAQVSNAFSVSYTLPVAAVVTVSYLPNVGWGQFDLTIAAAGVGEAEAVSVTIARAISGVTETVIDPYTAASSLTILDPLPTINGTNEYTVTTISADGATSETTATMITTEQEWSFLSAGDGFSQVVKFGGNLKLDATPTMDSRLVKTSGRSRPIGMYSTSGELVVAGRCIVVAGLGSSADDLEAILQVPGKKCYRDVSGRRVFGRAEGHVSRENSAIGAFEYSVTETA